ncbi:hypothetical protein G6F65_023364 [Rhizopus arrhizus]|nr:hypothetical protein G6F65_023364 [Rhizopus arrhizus]
MPFPRRSAMCRPRPALCDSGWLCDHERPPPPEVCNEPVRRFACPRSCRDRRWRCLVAGELAWQDRAADADLPGPGGAGCGPA